MTHDEMRMIRREIINHCLQDVTPFWRVKGVGQIKKFVRNVERYRHGYEMRAYTYGWEWQP